MIRSSSALPGNRSRTRTQAMIVPITMLIAVMMSDDTTVSVQGRAGVVVGEDRHERRPAATGGLDDDGGERDQDQQAEPDHGDAEPEGRRRGQRTDEADRRLRAGRPPADDRGGHYWPASAWILVRMPSCLVEVLRRWPRPSHRSLRRSSAASPGPGTGRSSRWRRRPRRHRRRRAGGSRSRRTASGRPRSSGSRGTPWRSPRRPRSARTGSRSAGSSRG